MPNPVKILAFAGSLRNDSYNKKLIKLAAQGAKAAGAEVTLINLKDYPLPIYDQDIEDVSGIPEKGKELKQLMIEHDGFLIASPEYNSSISAVLKNVIDWASRQEGDEPSLIAYKGKTAAIMSASPSFLGGLRGLVTLRSILGNIGVLVLPTQITVSKAFEAFDKQGNLTNEKKQESVLDLGKSLVETISKLK